MNKLKLDEWKSTNNFLMFPLRLIAPGLTSYKILQSAAAHWGLKMKTSERQDLANQYIRNHNLDVQLEDEMSVPIAAGLQGLGYSFTNVDPVCGILPSLEIVKGDAVVKIRQDYFRCWLEGSWSDRLFTTLCAILSKIGGKKFTSMSWHEIAARQVGSTNHLDEIYHATMSRQEVRTEVDRIVEKGLLARVVYHKRISYYSCRHDRKGLEKAVAAYKAEGAKRKGITFQLDANHFNKEQPL